MSKIKEKNSAEAAETASDSVMTPATDLSFSAEDGMGWPVAGDVILRDFKADKTVRISARHGNGLTELKDAIEDILRESKIYIEKLYSYNEAGKISIIRKYGQLLSEEYVAEGIEVKAYVPVEIYDKVQ